MRFSDVIGQKHIKAHLLKGVETGRVPHAQLFVGAAGVGVLPTAIAYANELLCSKHEKGSAGALQCEAKVKKLAHPDLHFIYPTNTNDTIKKHPVSDLFLEDWRNFIKENPYGNLFQWLQFLGIENKQGNINVDEAADLTKKMSLKAYEGGYKIFIIWMADKMNTACANKILKIVEEPPKNTVLLLLTENEEHILTTIHSRCQKLHFPLLSEVDINNQLISNQLVESSLATNISRLATGDYNKALQLLNENSETAIFETWFLSWVRGAFMAKGNKKAINDLLSWSTQLAGEGRETQKKFLTYCIEIFRQGLLKNYKVDELVFFKANDAKFSIEKFAPFVHQNNIFEIIGALEKAIYHIERNGNAKLIFTDLSIQLTRLIHKKELV